MKKSISKKTTRRNFIKASALFGGALILPSCATKRVKGANDRFSVALIGVGGIGIQAINNLKNAPEADIVAGCDVDDDRSARNYKVLSQIERFKNIPRYRDYRVMLDKMGDDIDGVIVSTPDHMHYPISAWCMAQGKHTFCQKPLARTVWECREMARLAKKYGVYTQMGNQGHTSDGWRSLKEWYDSGLLGKIEEIFIWTSRPARFWKQGIDVKYPKGDEKIPNTLDYDLWLGVAPYQPYSKAFVPHDWRGVRNFGCGAIGDMGCHFMDVPYSAFDLGFPCAVSAQTDPFNDYSWPYSSTLEYEFNSPKGKNGKIYLHWYDGYRKPEHIRGIDDAFLKDKRNADVTVIVCEKETVVTDEYGRRLRVYPNKRMIELKKANAFPEKTIERSVSPMNAQLEFVKMCLASKEPNANFGYASTFTEMALLGMVAMTQGGKKIEYDASKMSFKGNKDADRYLTSLYDYRKGFIE